MRYRDANSNLKSHIRSLHWVMAVQFLVIAGLWHGWEKAREELRVHIPPDLRSGAVIGANQADPSNVYAFAGYILQQLNRWPKDGAQDYGRRVFNLSAFLTPQYREFLIADLDLRGKRGELNGRTRALQLIAGFAENRVAILAPGVWTVNLDVNILETVRGMNVKSVNIHYPLRVVRHAVDPELNPWGLALDGYAGDGPKRLTEDDMKKIETGPTGHHEEVGAL